MIFDQLHTKGKDGFRHVILESGALFNNDSKLNKNVNNLHIKHQCLTFKTEYVFLRHEPAEVNNTYVSTFNSTCQTHRPTMFTIFVPLGLALTGTPSA
jgi:hypothetical protein